jgi:hypothetical protein
MCPGSFLGQSVFENVYKGLFSLNLVAYGEHGFSGAPKRFFKHALNALADPFSLSGC